MHLNDMLLFSLIHAYQEIFQQVYKEFEKTEAFSYAAKSYFFA